MRTIDRDVDRCLALLRSRIRGRGFTQLEVQGVLGWGRSYISQLLTKQKALRFEQVFLILEVIGVEPDLFFAEVFQYPTSGRPPGRRRQPGGPTTAHWPRRGAAAALTGPHQAPQLPREELHRLQAVHDGLVSLLKAKGMFTATELTHAIEKAKHEP